MPSPVGRGRARQNAIYRPGALGIAPTVPTDVTELERRAKRAMSRKAWAAGVSAVIDGVLAELDLTMGLVGAATVADITRDLLVGA